MKMILIGTFLLVTAASSLAEIVKWIDDEGNVHYGEKAPPEYEAQSSKVKMDGVSIVAPEEKVREQNEAYAREQQREKDNKLIELQHDKQQPALPEKASDDTQRILSREECRDTYSRYMQPKKLVLCFRQAEAAAKNSAD